VNKLRWGKFYWSDWADDPALALCSHAAQGVWMRLLCIAAQGTPYGHVTVNGKAPPIEDLGRLVRPPLRPARMERIIAELERRGVAKRTPDGKIFSARLVSDWRMFASRSKAANARWHKENGSGLHMQNPSFAFLESDAEAAEGVRTPSTPRKKEPSQPSREREGLVVSFSAKKKGNGHDEP
jgi:hypothetical protein